MRWTEPSLPEDGGLSPTIKNHSVTFYRGLLYCFGGYDGRRNNQTLLIYSLREGKWIQFGAQYNVPPGRNGHTATLATSRRSRSSMRARRNVHLDLNDDNMQLQQQPGGPLAHDSESAATAMNEIDSSQAGDYGGDSESAVTAMNEIDSSQAGDYGGGENMQGGDVIEPIIPINEENSMDTDDDDDEDAQIVIIGGWLGSG